MCYRATQTSKAYEYADFYAAPIINEADLEDHIYYHATLDSDNRSTMTIRIVTSAYLFIDYC